jgi:membrane associated rhomboid family serine protease
MIPIGDDRPKRHVPVITALLLVSITLIFLWQNRLAIDDASRVIYAFAITPSQLLGNREPPRALEAIPPWLTLISYGFLHAGWAHMIGNALFLWVFAVSIEDAIGSVRFTLLYLAAGMVSGLVQAWAIQHASVQLIGASGAISGVLGAYAVLFPRSKLYVLLPVFIGIRRFRWPAWIFLGAWFALQVGIAVLFSSTAGGIAFLAHISGFLAGAALVTLLRPKGLALFGGRRTAPPPG